MSYGKNFVVEDSDESDYENRITRKPRNLKTNTEVVRTSQERRKYNENDDDDDDDSEDDRRQIKSRSNTRGRRNTDNNEIDENDQRYTKRESVRRSGDAFVPKSLDREYDRGGGGGGGDGGAGSGGRIQTAGRTQRPPPATAWVSGKRDERTEPENYRNEPVRSWAKATPKGETRDIRESNERRSISRHSSDEEEDNNIPRSNRNRSPADRNGPVRQPPRGERIPNRYTRDGYDEEEPSYNNQRGDRDRDRDRDRERDRERDQGRDRDRERGDSRSRSRSGSNSQRYPPNSRNRYGNYEEEDNENEHEHEEEEIPRNRLANRQNYIQDLSYGAVVQRSDRELDLTRGSSGTVEDDLLSDDGNGADIIKQEHDLNERNANDLGGVMRLGANSSFVFLCPANGGATELVQCVIIRDRENLGGSIYPSYKLYLEKNMKLLIIAQKMNLNTTSNYHLFDMTRGAPSGNLSKKSGNYLGKLRAHDTQRTEYALVTRSEEREEVGAIIFERIGIFSQLKEGCQPRKMTVLLPNLNAESEPIPHKVSKKSGQKKSLVDMLKNSETGRMFLLKSKEPVYENGNYRLNFHGRVSVPSVKNFQLSSPDDPAHVVCQFGKVGEERFHLDYKAPLNAFQAFSLALCHFDT